MFKIMIYENILNGVYSTIIIINDKEIVSSLIYFKLILIIFVMLSVIIYDQGNKSFLLLVI